MIDPASHVHLRAELSKRMQSDCAVLDRLRDEIRPLYSSVRRIQPRATTSISLVATDGGNNRLEFDPFLVQLIRVVDSSNNEYCLEAVTPTTSIAELSAVQFEGQGRPRTPLGAMMAYLGVDDLTKLSHMIRRNEDGRPVSPSWVTVYRELVEWAVLFSIVQNKDFATDTLIVTDGLLRSVIFAHELFIKLMRGMEEAISRQRQSARRKIYLAGVAKHSKVLTRYRLAMALEGVLATDFPAYVEVPREIEERAYLWSAYARGDDLELGGEVNKFAGGKMYFVKFGAGRRDPIWPVDIALFQVSEAHVILGSMLSDATNGFPVPFYPQCLQRAHEGAALAGFDFDLLQDDVIEGVRSTLGTGGSLLDAFRLQDADPARARYE